MDIASVRNLGEGELLTPITGLSGSADARQPDYAWTHSAPVDGFFAVLTIVIAPIAIVRLLRRLRTAG